MTMSNFVIQTMRERMRQTKTDIVHVQSAQAADPR